MIKLLLLICTAGLIFLLHSSDSAVVTVCTTASPSGCYNYSTLNEYANSKVQIKHGQNATINGSLALLLSRGVHNLNHDLDVNGITEEVLIKGLNQDDTRIVIYDEARIMASNVHRFKLISIRIQHAYRPQNISVLLTSVDSIVYNNVIFKHIDTSITSKQPQNINITNCYFNNSELHIASDANPLYIENTTFLGNHVPPSGFPKCLPTSCTSGLKIQCSIASCNFPTFGLSLVIKYSSFLNWHSGVTFQCRNNTSDIAIEHSSFFQNKHGVEIGASIVNSFSVLSTRIQNNNNGLCILNSTFNTINISSARINHNTDHGIKMLETTVDFVCICDSTLTQNGYGIVYTRSSISGGEKTANFQFHRTNVSKSTSSGVVLTELSAVQYNTQMISFQNCTFELNGKSAISVQSFGPIFQIEDCAFRYNQETAVTAFFNDVELQGNVQFINNTGTRGGALSLIYSQVKFADNSYILFEGNVAAYGGAICVASQKYLAQSYLEDIFIDAEEMGYNIASRFPCFYQISSSLTNSTVNITVTFSNNRAVRGGNSIHGASLHNFCPNVDTLNSSQNLYNDTINKIFRFQGEASAISSDPTRVCFCFNDTVDCNKTKLVHNVVRYPGEEFTVPLILVGYEFSAVTGIIHATVITDSFLSLDKNQEAQTAQRDKCNQLEFSLNAQPGTLQVIKLATQASPAKKLDISEIEMNNKSIHNEFCSLNPQCTALLTTPIYINISIVPCPLGFQLSGKSTCECDETLSMLSERVNGLNCEINDHIGYINRIGTIWVGVDTPANTSSIRYLWNEYCPQDYCNEQLIPVDPTNPDNQCQFKHSGILCGSCKMGYSLSLGSNRCGKCADNARISLVLVFLVAGFLLVVIIKFLDLTVANGTVNGIIFYANIVWGYNRILLPAPNKNDPLHWILTVPIAWINLDFGIETCFFVGLDSFVKAWLQFLFPLYIWSIAFSIILISHYSKKATKWFGNNSVAVLATLFLLSYGKILRNIMTILDTRYMHYSNSTTTRIVWAIDGNLEYGKYPHGFLLVFGIIVLVFVWLPYTLALLLVPILKPKSRHKPLRWINTLKPLFDAYYGPYNDRLIYQCWIGILLVVRGVLLILVVAVIPYDNILMLGIISAILLVIGSFSIYKKVYLSFSENACLLNLAILSGLWSRYNSLTTATSSQEYPIYTAVSISLALLQFIFLIAVHKFCRSRFYNCEDRLKKGSAADPRDKSKSIELGQMEKDSGRFRDSILSTISFTNTWHR